MKFLGLPQLTTIDYPDRLALIVYTPDCNFACGACHAGLIKNSKATIDEIQFIEFLEAYPNFDFVKGLVICGGEPTIHLGLEEFLKNIKEDPKTRNLAIKLDTNGTNPEVLEKLLKNKLVDYIAMDIKSSRELYPRVVGKSVNPEDIERSMNLATQFPGYEFRTTIFPVARDDGIKFMTPDEMLRMAEWVKHTTGKEQLKHYIQPFKAKSSEEMIDPRFAKENLPKELQQTPMSLLEEIKSKLASINYPVEIR
jgi:pyruvate formate lyase activating enzyme